MYFKMGEVCEEVELDISRKRDKIHELEEGM